MSNSYHCQPPSDVLRSRKQLTERNVTLNILCLFFRLWVVPRRVLVCLSVDFERIVRGGTLPRTLGCQGRGLENRLVLDGGWGKVDIAFDSLVVVGFGDDGFGNAGSGGHVGGRTGCEGAGGVPGLSAEDGGFGEVARVEGRTRELGEGTSAYMCNSLTRGTCGPHQFCAQLCPIGKSSMLLSVFQSISMIPKHRSHIPPPSLLTEMRLDLQSSGVHEG